MNSDLSLDSSLPERLRVQIAELEQQLAERTRELETARKDLEAFSYSVAHDLRAPLRAVNAFSTILLEEHSAELTAEARRVLNYVTTNARRMEQLIEALLRFSRLDQRPLVRQTVDIAELVQEVLDDLRKGQDADRTEVRVGELTSTMGDPASLREVFAILLSNAFKFSSKKKRATIEVDSHRVEGEQVYRVRDDGAGFDPRFAGKLFGVFQRMHGAEEFQGIGIGLALARRIVLRHGGRIWAESAVDKGAAFYVALPL